MKSVSIPPGNIQNHSISTSERKFRYHRLLNADEKCPVFPGMGNRLYWPFEDPAAFAGSEEDKTQKFREIRDLIERRIIDWLRALDQSHEFIKR